MLAHLRLMCILALAICCSAPLGAAISVSLSPLHPTAPVGTLIPFSAIASNVDTGDVWFRFRVREVGSDYRVIRDFGPSPVLNWTTIQEGSYQMEVAAEGVSSGDVTTTTTLFQITPLATGSQPVVSPTANSLVFLYSAPACPVGQRMRVEFQGPDLVSFNTPYQACKSGVTMNFYLAGLKAATNYAAHHRIDTGTQFIVASDVLFTTGALPPGLYNQTVLAPLASPTPEPLLLGSTLASGGVAQDLNGNVVWYGPQGGLSLTRAERGGVFWGIIEDPSGNPTLEIMRKLDLAGTTLLETNVARVNQQLKALGKRAITVFHHEARTLPDGRIAALGSVEQILTNVQGAGPVDVIGDMVLVFDTNLNVIFAWDTFDNLDPHRAAILGETCASGPGCPPIILAANANDWTHGNSISQTPDGNLLYSTRNQDWIIKISYDNGEGDGHIIWKLGVGGDFQIQSSDPYPWFSHQHDANFDPSDPTHLLVFDDGNTRISIQNQGYSRGQAIQVDEPNLMATLILNADPNLYSFALGTAERLSDGNYNFDFGYVIDPNGTHAYSVEVDPSGNVLYKAMANAPLYRWVRMTDMYTPN
jgi:arylsulfate sulfotransferase